MAYSGRYSLKLWRWWQVDKCISGRKKRKWRSNPQLMLIRVLLDMGLEATAFNKSSTKALFCNCKHSRQLDPKDSMAAMTVFAALSKQCLSGDFKGVPIGCDLLKTSSALGGCLKSMHCIWKERLLVMLLHKHSEQQDSKGCHAIPSENFQEPKSCC